MRRDPARSAAQAQEALTRATTSTSETNLPTIYQSFLDRGIPGAEIRPRENVFTFNAWKALGRFVRRGERGVRIITWIPVAERVEADGTVRPSGKRPKSAYVFHVSQTQSAR